MAAIARNGEWEAALEFLATWKRQSFQAPIQEGYTDSIYIETTLRPKYIPDDPRACKPLPKLQPRLGGSWVDIRGVISPLIWVIIIVTLLITPLRTTHEPPSTPEAKLKL